MLDAALDAVARVASPELAPALPHVVQKGLANARGATQDESLRAIVALQKVAPDATTDALVDGITTSKNARGAFACQGSGDRLRPFQAWLSSHSDRLAASGGQARLGGERRRSKSRGRPRGP